MSRVSPIYDVITSTTESTCCSPFIGTRGELPVSTFTNFRIKSSLGYLELGSPSYCDWFETHRIAVFYTDCMETEPIFLKIYSDGEMTKISEGDPDYEFFTHECPDIVNTHPSIVFYDIIEQTECDSRASTPEIVVVTVSTPSSHSSKRQKIITSESSLIESF